MKITKITKPILPVIVKDAMDALQVVAKKYGLTLEKESGSYSETSFTFKATFKTAAAEAVANDLRKQYADLYDLPSNVFDIEVTDGKNRYKVTDIKPGRNRYPISVKRTDGKAFKISVDHLKQMMLTTKAIKVTK